LGAGQQFEGWLGQSATLWHMMNSALPPQPPALRQIEPFAVAQQTGSAGGQSSGPSQV
jgi:hypothetical protein